MSVINAYEDYSKRQAGLRTGTRVWTVLVSDKDDGPVTAQQATGVPRRGDPFPGNDSLIAMDVQAAAASSCYFIVTIPYEVPDSGGTTPAGNPLDEPADIRWGTSNSVDAIDQDTDGKPDRKSVV